MMYTVAVIGATGAVGTQTLKILESRKFPVGELVPFASDKSKGKPVTFKGKSHPCRVLGPGCFDGVDIVISDVSDELSKVWVPAAAEAGAWVIDNSSTFRYDPRSPLIVPEVNGGEIDALLKRGARDPRDRILCGPNCSTVQLVVALKPIADRWGLERVVVSTYQSTSGAGARAVDELRAQTGEVLAGRPAKPGIFPHRIAFNCIPQIGSVKDDGYTGEETKIIAETRKILGMPSLRVSVTAVRVPTMACHGESVNVECAKPFEVAEVRESLRRFPGVVVLDEPAQSVYPLGESIEGSKVEGAAGRDAVYVGRIRRDSTVDNGLNLWVVSDNLRKGAALNAVQIGEILIEKRAL
jgi:aspartate-semialdehyde dehydrogenase